MDNTELIRKLNCELQTELSQSMAQHDLLQKLSEVINHLIQTDFPKLVHILYKTDISETRLKLLLQQNSNEDAARVIARLIIEREQQKIDSRSRFTSKDDVAGEEKW